MDRDAPAPLRVEGTPFDASRCILNAYRGTYAERHADAGVAIDVLAQLLDHRNINITAATTASARTAAATRSTGSPDAVRRAR